MELRHRDFTSLTEYNPGDLVYIGVYTSKTCNLCCRYCFGDSGLPETNETTFEERKSVLEQAKRLGAKVMVVAGAGEPLCDPSFLKTVDHAYSLGLGTLLYTNGTYGNGQGDVHPIAVETAKFLYDHDVTVMMKLESTDPKLHDYLTKVEGSHQAAIQSLAMLKKVGFGIVENGVTRLGFAALYTWPTLNSLNELQNFAEQKGAKLVVDVVGIRGRAKEIKDTLPTLDEIKKAKHGLGSESGIAASGECIFWKYGLIIDNVGEARFCTEVITNDIGNIRQSTLAELLETKNRKYPPMAGTFTCPLKKIHYMG